LKCPLFGHAWLSKRTAATAPPPPRMHTSQRLLSTAAEAWRRGASSSSAAASAPGERLARVAWTSLPLLLFRLRLIWGCFPLFFRFWLAVVQIILYGVAAVHTFRYGVSRRSKNLICRKPLFKDFDTGRAAVQRIRYWVSRRYNSLIWGMQPFR